MSNKYSQKLLDSAKKSTADAIKTASRRAIQKTTEATGDLIGNKIADEITKQSSKELCSKELLQIKLMKYQKKKIYISRRKTRNY